MSLVFTDLLSGETLVWAVISSQMSYLLGFLQSELLFVQQVLGPWLFVGQDVYRCTLRVINIWAASNTVTDQMEVARGERRELRERREERKARCGEWCGDSIKPFKVTDNAGPVKWGDGRYLFMGVSSQSAVLLSL